MIAPVEDQSLEAETIRRIIWRIVPFLMLCYFIAFVDRVNAGFAALQMNKDVGISASAFGFGGGLFYITYVLFEIPSNLAMRKVGARLWIARILVTWGLASAAMALVVGPYSFYLVRLLLGAAEAGFFPGVILYLTYWFPPEYRGRIVAIFMVSIPISSFLGSPISAALLQTNGWLGYHGWQWMFVFEAIPAVLLGIVCVLRLAERSRRRPLPARRPTRLADGPSRQPDHDRQTDGRRTRVLVVGDEQQIRLGGLVDLRGGVGRQPVPLPLATADHQIVRRLEHGDGVSQCHAVRHCLRADDLLGSQLRPKEGKTAAYGHSAGPARG